MSFPRCPVCGAELGPWEGARCLSHDPVRAQTIADKAVLVLEKERGAIYLHDIQRGIGRETGRQAEWRSVSAVVGADRRFCWSGKGMYALFRHGRIPGVRTLADVATFILLAARQPLAPDELRFLLKWQGYRFQDVSLDGALNREGRFAYSWSPAGARSSMGWKVTLKEPDVESARFDVLREPIEHLVRVWRDVQALDTDHADPGRLEQQAWPVDALFARWSTKVRDGLEERARRLGPMSPGPDP